MSAVPAQGLPDLVTPHRHRIARRFCREVLADLRRQARDIRRLRASERFLDREDAEAMAESWGREAARLRERWAWWLTVRVEKYANVSPAAAERLARR